jgi:hypothetical protein
MPGAHGIVAICAGVEYERTGRCRKYRQFQPGFMKDHAVPKPTRNPDTGLTLKACEGGHSTLHPADTDDTVF